ncbi:MAG: hypothetical protein HUU50_03005 [Candidatus Brocadiae bacterium]|nr:hypothetical protein [Candidatus Brocadiia bacterium]
MYFYIFLIVFLPVFVVPQSIQGWLEPQSGMNWVLQGKSDLPESANLVAVLLYEKEEVPHSRQYQTLQQGKFSFEYQPLAKKMPAGLYSWQVASLHAEEGKSVFFEETFYYKTPYQRRRELREEMFFFIQLFQGIQDYVKDCKQNSKDLLEKKQDYDKAKLYLEEIHKKRMNILEKWEKKKEKEAFPRSQENQRQTEDLLQNLQKFSYAVSLKIYLAYSFPLTGSYAILKKNYPTEKEQKRNQEKAERQIQFAIKQVLGRFSLPENLSQKELHEDMAWFNGWFKNIAIEYPKIAKGGIEWEKKASLFLEEIDTFSLCTEDYKQSPLSKKYPEIIVRLSSLSQNARSLIMAYTKQLPPEETIKKLRKDMESLLEIVQKEQQESLVTKEKAAQEAQKSLFLLEKQYTEIQETFKIQDIQEFLSKEKYYRERHQNFLEQIILWQPYFPNQYLALRKASINLMTRMEFQRYILEGKLSIQNQQTKAQIKEMDIEIKVLMQQIQEKGF